MSKWLKEFQGLVWAATLIAVALVWAYQSFATIAYVDQKHQGVLEILHEINDHVKTIDDRTFELSKRDK